MHRVICFGDSWAAGAELAPTERPFVHWVANHFDLPYQNLSQEGMSLGLILHRVVGEINNLNANDLIIVIVPPDTRWYDENQEDGFYSLMNWQRSDYFKFLNRKTLEWFRYHHCVFVYTLQKIFADIGCQFVMAHNYGQIDDLKRYHLPINFQKFLSHNSLVDILTSTSVDWKSYPEHLAPAHRYDQDGPPDEIFAGPYFHGCHQHPNQDGHKFIAQLMIDKITGSDPDSNHDMPRRDTVSNRVTKYFDD